VVGEENGEIVGFCVAQLQLELGPVWVSPEKRNSLLMAKLTSQMRKEVKNRGISGGFFLRTEQEKVAEYAERLGLVRTKDIVLEGQI
jgi:hypothetical protein